MKAAPDSRNRPVTLPSNDGSTAQAAGGAIAHGLGLHESFSNRIENVFRRRADTGVFASLASFCRYSAHFGDRGRGVTR